MKFKMVNGEWVEEEIFEETSDQFKEIKKENDHEKMKKEYERRQRKSDNFFTVFLGENHSSGLTLKQQHKEELRGGGNARHDWKHMKRGDKK